MGCSAEKISQAEIDDFMKISHSAEDDSRRCRRIIGQLLYDKKHLKAQIHQSIVPYIDAGYADRLRDILSDD